jgi:acetolactate synthase-1/2/3 large subunit
MIRVADFIAGWFADVIGARKVFLVTGAGSMHLSDGVAKHSQLEAVCLHHEQAVSMAVEAYSRASGEMGVAYVSTGPAVTNAVTGLAGAWQDSVACFFVSGQVKVAETSADSGVDGLRQFGVQELNILPVVQSLTKYSATVSKPTDILF